MTRLGTTVVALASLALAGGCGSGGEAHVWDFEDGTTMGFYADQSDFSEATRGGLDTAVEALPSPLTGKGLRVTADNKSDDQWAFIARELGAAEGVVAGQRYEAKIAIKVASDAPSGCAGVGGSPEAVIIKGGVVTTKPAALAPDASGYIGFSAKKGSQTMFDVEAVDLGNIATGAACEGEHPWKLMERSGTMEVTAPADGKLWVYVGTDSGYETAHTISYDEVSVTLTAK